MMQKHSFLILSLIVSISLMNYLYALDLSTPEKTTKLLVKAIQEKDYSLWYKLISNEDLQTKEEIISSKNRENNTKNKEEYVVGSLIPVIADLEKNKKNNKSTYDLLFIKSVYLWDDKYAEVLLFLPIDVIGMIAPPVKFSFIKENKEWKMSYMLSFSNFLTCLEHDNHINVICETVNIYFKLFKETAIERENIEKAVKRDYTMSDQLSENYFKKWSTDKNNHHFLQLWVATGDIKAQQIAKEQYGEINPDMLKMLFEDISIEGTKENPEFNMPFISKPVKELSLIKSFSCPAAYRKFINLYPDNLDVVNKSRYELSSLYLQLTNYESAEKELSLIIDTSDTTRTKTEAKVRLAWLYWDQLGNKAAAQKLWKELDDIGRLPEGAPYDKSSIK